MFDRAICMDGLARTAREGLYMVGRLLEMTENRERCGIPGIPGSPAEGKEAV